jgi:hypothetical protein
MKHAKLGYGGSVAFRTIACPGWISLAETLPPDWLGRSSPAADEGTLCHMGMEALIDRKVMKPTSLVGLRFAGQEMTPELLEDLVLPTFDAYQREQRPGWLARYTEQKVKIHIETMPEIDAHGTADLIHVYDDRLDIGDWKFGYRPVSPDCDQLHFYGVGAIETIEGLRDLPLDFPVRLAVWQPRTDSLPATFDTTIEGLYLWKMTYVGALQQSQRIAPPRNIGSQCEFCPAKLICPEVKLELPSLVKQHPGLLNPEELGELAALATGLGDLQGQTMAEVRGALQNGVQVPKWKLVAGNRRRSWVSEEIAAQAIGELGIDPFICKVKSVARVQDELRELGVDIYDVMGDNIAESRNDPRPVPDDARGQALPDSSPMLRAFANVMSIPK